MVKNSGQMKIMQMSFMIIGVFFFFVLVGLFVLGIAFGDVRSGAEELARAQAISSIGVIAGMSELNYDADDTMSVDEDKLKIMSGGFSNNYEDFWPVASIEVYKVYNVSREIVECPSVGCNYYSVYSSGQRNIEKVSSYVSICKRVKEFGSVHNKCEVGKILVGVEIRESEVGR